MNVIKKFALAVAAIMMSFQAYGDKALIDSSKVAVMDPYKQCVQTKGGTNACDGGGSCVTFRGNVVISHDHACITAGGLRASDYKGEKRQIVLDLIRRHQYLM